MASVCENFAQSLRLLPLLLVMIVVLSGHACLCVGALTVDDLYPFDIDNGDTVLRPSLPNGSLRSGQIPLPYPVPVFGDPSLPEAYVSINGVVDFRHPKPYDDFSNVAAFSTHLFATDYSDDTNHYYGEPCRGVGCPGLAFRVVSDAALLADITSDIRIAFPSKALAAGFTAGSALIATWVNVSQCCKELPEFVHTFQAVIAFNRRTVFVGLLYPKLTFGGPNVRAGIYNPNDPGRSFELPTSFSTASFDELSNVGEAGKWWFGLDQIDKKAILGTFAYLDDPLPAKVCSIVLLHADAGVDECGNPRVMDWDFNNDGAFDDKTGTSKSVELITQALTPGVHPIRARVQSSSPCTGAAANPLVLNTTLTLTVDYPISIFIQSVEAASGNSFPYVNETVFINWLIGDSIYCNDPPVTTLDCGLSSIAVEQEDPLSPRACRYSTPGLKEVTVTTTQNGQSASDTTTVNVVEYKPACLGQYPLGGRVIGQRGCSPYYWSLGSASCNYPVGAGIKRSTKLWLAFASRAPQDAQVIRSIYGNLTMQQAVQAQPNNQADRLASAAAAALLNALTLPYPYCPLTVKVKFRRALYSGADSIEVFFLQERFENYNNDNVCLMLSCS